MTTPGDPNEHVSTAVKMSEVAGRYDVPLTIQIDTRPAQDRQLLHARIDRDFTLHPPTAEQGATLDTLRFAFKTMAHHCVDLCPPSRELSNCLTGLEHALADAIAAVVRP